jgi:hypothetical protein
MLQREPGQMESLLLESLPNPLPDTLLACRKDTKMHSLDDICDVVELGQTVMSFGKFLSHKLLGSHLSLTNKTNEERVI